MSRQERKQNYKELHKGRRRISRGIIVAITVFALVVVGGIVLTLAMNFNETERTCTISGKESVRQEEGNQYRVYTEDCGTLQVSDSLLRMRWDSADTFGTLKEGSEVTVTTIGYRIPFLSMFPNILEVK